MATTIFERNGCPSILALWASESTCCTLLSCVWGAQLRYIPCLDQWNIDWGEGAAAEEGAQVQRRKAMTYRVDSQEPSGTHVSSKGTKAGETIDQGPGRKANSRTRHSFYLDTAVVRSLDQAYKQTSHELYPREMSKSDFLEACLRYALSDLDTIKYHLSQEE